MQVGKGPVRTGVTAILPRGRKDVSGVFGAYAVGNGNGEMTGTIWIDESGIVGTPICITNTHSVGVVRDAVIDWMIRNGGTEQLWGLPVVAETWDGYLNDLNGFHVKPQHVFAALDGAHGGAIEEGNVGGGTGMHTFEFKGGTGTSSRLVRVKDVGDYTVGVLVQSNFGRRWQLQVAGVPVGREWPEDAPFTQAIRPGQRTRLDHRRDRDRCSAAADAAQARRDDGPPWASRAPAAPPATAPATSSSRSRPRTHRSQRRPRPAAGVSSSRTTSSTACSKRRCWRSRNRSSTRWWRRAR